MAQQPLDQLPDATHLRPDPAFVEALMNVYQFGQWKPSDRRMREGGLSTTVREGCVRRIPDGFWPPERLCPKRDSLPITVQRYWHEFADYVLREAQQRGLSEQTLAAILTALEPKAVKRLFRGDAIRDHQEHIYMDIDTGEAGLESAEIVEEVRAVTEALRKKVAKAISGVLSDGKFMAQVQKTIEVATEMDVKLVFPQIIKWLDQMRTDVEKPGDSENFLSIMRQAIAILGYEDRVDVELLPTEVALLRGCKGLYAAAAKQGEKAKIYLPMSVYGTNRLVPLEEAFETLAHELAHHQTVEPNAEDRKVHDAYARETADGKHGAEHNSLTEVLTARNLKVLQSLNIEVEQKGGACRMVVKPSDMAGVDPDVLRSTVAALVARQLGAQRQRSALQRAGGASSGRRSVGEWIKGLFR